MKKSIKFLNVAKTVVLTIVLAQGKSGFNIKASQKNANAVKGKKGAPTKDRAATGCRAKFTTLKEGEAAFTKLSDEARKQGWTVVPKIDRNAFTSIPSAKAAA